MRKENNGVCKAISLRKTAKFLKKHDNFVILTHSSPDGDTLGSAYALYYGLKEIGKMAAVICPDVIPSKYSYFVNPTDSIDKQNATVVALDVADKALLGSLSEEFGNKVDLTVDHHISNTKYAKYLYLDSSASATCEIIYELLCFMKVNINTRAAKALYTGIATDTGCFKYSNVTAKTHEIASELYEYDIKADEINKLMFDTKSKKLLELERMVLDTAEYHFDNRCIILSVTADMQNKTGCSGSDLEGIAIISRSVEGVIAGVTVKQTDDKVFKISLRTYFPLDASAICKELGGGGHKAAAGATLEGTLSEVKEQILSVIGKYLEEADNGTDSH
ncbi:MAG: bifunctional oligoribonuclease/PAP phosphatase NrnA [Clostridia bacterium]|nr:bifunctional oligoribonuclease/PAP phosphatase NrnA [Clostridia bacterium]